MTNEEALKLATGLSTDFKCESDTMVDFCNTIIKALKQESVLDKIRTEIKGKYRVILKGTPKDDWAVRWNDCIDEVLQIIDKYRTGDEKP